MVYVQALTLLGSRGLSLCSLLFYYWDMTSFTNREGSQVMKFVFEETSACALCPFSSSYFALFVSFKRIFTPLTHSVSKFVAEPERLFLYHYWGAILYRQSNEWGEIEKERATEIHCACLCVTRQKECDKGPGYCSMHSVCFKHAGNSLRLHSTIDTGQGGRWWISELENWPWRRYCSSSWASGCSGFLSRLMSASHDAKLRLEGHMRPHAEPFHLALRAFQSRQFLNPMWCSHRTFLKWLPKIVFWLRLTRASVFFS